MVRLMKEAKLSSEAVTRLAGIMRASTERFEAEWRYLNESFFADCVSCTKEIGDGLAGEQGMWVRRALNARERAATASTNDPQRHKGRVTATMTM